MAMEVDGPSHFLRGDVVRLANGATMLKRRQLYALNWQLVMVLYWEWDLSAALLASARPPQRR